MRELFNSIAILLIGIVVIILTYVLCDERERNKSHWKATEHELNYIWNRINILEGDVIEID